MKSKRLEEALPPDIESFLAVERAPLAEKEDMRRRALARARATVPPAPTNFWTNPFLGAAGLALVAASGIAGAAWHGGLGSRAASLPPNVSTAAAIPSAHPEPLSSVPVVPFPSTTSSQTANETSVRVPALGQRRVPSTPRPSELEVTILQTAQAAIAGGDPAAALTSIDEHERRFPNGQLAEEREVLRVQALGAMGRKDDARRMAALFSRRFPHSVLLSRIDRGARVFP